MDSFRDEWPLETAAVEQQVSEQITFLRQQLHVET